MPIALWYAGIFGLEVYNRMQNLSSCASVNAWCNFVTDRCHQISVHAVAGKTPQIRKTTIIISYQRVYTTVKVSLRCGAASCAMLRRFCRMTQHATPHRYASGVNKP